MPSSQAVSVVGLGIVLVSCTAAESPPVAATTPASESTLPSTTTLSITTLSTTTTSPESAPSTSPPSESTTTTFPNPFAHPVWLGTRALPLRPDGYGQVQPTPAELRDRELETFDLLPPPAGEGFEWSIEAVPDQVRSRSTWKADCPVSVEELAYVTVSHVGFDGRFHTGELLVNARAAEDLVGVFRQLHERRFPLEQMRVIRAEELEAPPTGDGNDTTSFVCRPAVGSTRWSQHAFGLAVDVNPFHNPYLKGDLVLPELASAYTDRSDLRPGMIMPGDVVTEAFSAIGWGWGGDWNTLRDWMHFSENGR